MVRNFFTLKRIIIVVLILAAVVCFSLPGSSQKKDPDKDREQKSLQHEPHKPDDDHKHAGQKHDDQKPDDGQKHDDHKINDQKEGAHQPGQVKLSPEAVKRANL